MTAAEKHIRHFNLMQGNLVSKGTLQRLLSKLPADPALNELKGKLKKAIAQINGETVQLNFVPLKYPTKLTGVKNHPKKKNAPEWAEKHRRAIEKQNKKMPKPIRDMLNLKGYLHGLECNPPEAQGSGLGFTKDGQKKIYDMVTNMILDTMKKDGLFWRTPWKEGTGKLGTRGVYATNFATNTKYRGINYWMLNLVASLAYNHKSPFYLTMNQINDRGGSVKKGASPWPVLFYRMIYISNGKKITEEQYAKLSDADKLKAVVYPIIQYYHVFNGDDIQGIKFPNEPEERGAVEPIETAEKILDEMPKRPPIRHSKELGAYYVPSQDYIHMPNKGLFNQDQEYYSTLFHELVHSTGHPTRLNRKMGRQGTPEYAFEELVAELGASYINAEAGILYFTLKNSAAYLSHWKTRLIKMMHDDNKFFLKAAAKAQEASDFILKIKKGEPVTVKKRKVRADRPAAKSERKPDVKPEPAKSLSGVNYNYHEVDLGPYKKDFHRMFSDTIVQIHGLPGHGKTVWMMKYALHRAASGDKVLYVAREEYGRSVFDMKLKEHNINHPNLRFARTLEPEDIDWATVIILDSVDALGIDHRQMEELSAGRNKNWHVVKQSTKDGDFRGSQEWEHLVDIAGEIRNRKLILHKNRLDPDNSAKREKLLKSDAITEAKKRAEIRNAVKDQLKPKETEAQKDA